MGEIKDLCFSRIFPAHILSFVTDRAIDFQYQGKHRCFTPKQKRSLDRLQHFDATRLTNIVQAHGRRVIVLNERNSRREMIKKADGILTDQPDIPLVIRTADCLSVFLFSPRHNVIGLIHAGWKGSQMEILVNALSIMKKKWGVRPKEVIAAFGPAIQQCCYSVEERFKKYFPKETINRKSQTFLDLPSVNKNQLLSCGVNPENIHNKGICTCCNKQLFSFRRQGKKAGRMLSVMMIKN